MILFSLLQFRIPVMTSGTEISGPKKKLVIVYQNSWLLDPRKLVRVYCILRSLVEKRLSSSSSELGLFGSVTSTSQFGTSLHLCCFTELTPQCFGFVIEFKTKYTKPGRLSQACQVVLLTYPISVPLLRHLPPSLIYALCLFKISVEDFTVTQYWPRSHGQFSAGLFQFPATN